MADSNTERSRRHRAHLAGDHSLCLHGDVEGLPQPGPLVQAMLGEFPESDPTARALAVRLAELGQGHGSAAVNACRALAEWVGQERDRRHSYAVVR
jgi:hypothetical protein